MGSTNLKTFCFSDVSPYTVFASKNDGLPLNSSILNKKDILLNVFFQTRMFSHCYPTKVKFPFFVNTVLIRLVLYSPLQYITYMLQFEEIY